MADKKISELPALTTVNDSIEIPVNDGGTTKKISKLNLVAAGVVTKTSSTGSGVLPASTTANRDGSPAAGYIRFNTTDTGFEGYDGSAWGSIGGGATGGGADTIFWNNGQSVTVDFTVPVNTNSGSFGPTITVNSGITVTISAGSYWTIT
jgi:hypothetical protein